MNVKQGGTPFKEVRKIEGRIKKMVEYLYHYTSIENLALILKNRTIKYNNLLNVDDPEEAETEDLGKAGRHCLVSCWTSSSEDIIPMWNMYTPDMRGVRIKMRQYPFRQYTYNKGEAYFTENVHSYINYNSVTNVSIAANYLLLEKVEYTEDEELLKPKIITRTLDSINVTFENIGRCKRSCWEFQQECRYIIRTAPWSIKELENVKTPEEQMQLFNRILDINNIQFCNEIFLDLTDDAFEGMEILLAPKTTDAEYIIVEALLEKYCKGMNVKVRKSRIRIR